MTCGFVRVFSQVRGDDLPGGLHADGPFACVGAEGIDRWLAKCLKVYRKIYDVVAYAYRYCRFEKVFTTQRTAGMCSGIIFRKLERVGKKIETKHEGSLLQHSFNNFVLVLHVY